jgi:PAS domain S-box-containing protein
MCERENLRGPEAIVIAAPGEWAETIVLLLAVKRSSFSDLLAPPVFPGDEVKTFRAKLLNYALWANVALMVCCALAGLVGTNVPQPVVAFEFLFGLASLALRRRLLQGHVRWASAVLMGGGFVSATVAIALLGTIRVPVTGFYIALVVATGVLFDLRAMLRMIGLCSIAVGGLILAENAGWLPRPDYSVTLTQWVVTTALFGCVGFWTYAALETIREALRRSEREVAERRRAEHALKLSEFSVQEASVGTLWVAPDASILRVNRALCESSGFTEAELLELKVPALAPAFSQEGWPGQWQQWRERRRMSFETRARHKSGRLFPVQVEVNWIEFEGREYNFAFIRDVTATQVLEQQLRQSQKLEAIGTFAGGIAHDFNNILSGIYGYTALARHEAAGNAELLGHLDEISRGGRRAAELVRQILAFSRARGDETAITAVSWDRVVGEAAQLLRALSPSTIEFVRHVAAGLPAVSGNATQLHQIVMNLGTNAVQAMRDRSGRLSIGLDTVVADDGLRCVVPDLAEGTYVRLLISDTGGGMDAATQQRAFEPFFTTKGPGEGTGLGLSVVHGIVRRHRGAIRLVSELGRGTTVEVFLPALDAAAVVPPVIVAEPLRGHGERILVVDDEESVARSARLTLGRLGYVVEADTESRAALARLERDPRAFDLVFSDQTMPGLTGLDFALRLRTLRLDLPVVLASGYSPLLTAENIRAAGVREVLSKPYTPDEIAGALRRHLPARRGM